MKCVGSLKQIESWLRDTWNTTADEATCPDCGQRVRLDWSATDDLSASVQFEEHEEALPPTVEAAMWGQ